MFPCEAGTEQVDGSGDDYVVMAGNNTRMIPLQYTLLHSLSG